MLTASGWSGTWLLNMAYLELGANMTSNWIYRLHAITSQSAADASNAFWTFVAPGGDPEAQSYGVPLSASGQEPVSHCGISSAFTAEMLAKLKVLEAEMPSLWYYVVDAWTFELLEQRNGMATIGQPCAWEDVLGDAGLVVIQPEELP